MKKILPLAALLLLLSSCHSFKAGLFEDNLVLPLAEESADTLFYSVSLEYVQAGLPDETIDQINSTILTMAFDLEEQPGSMEETAVRYRESLIDEYLAENRNDEFQGFVRTWNDEISGSFEKSWNRCPCYTLTYYTFRGGAHGLYTITYLVFDPQTGAILTEDDLFRDGYLEPVTLLMQENIRQSFEELGPDVMDSIRMDGVAPNGNFLPGADGISWMFQPYDIAPYAMGAITADIPWEDLKPYLK